LTVEIWRERIVQMSLIKQEIARVDVEGLWPWHLPSVGVKEDEISRAEALIGERLDESYRAFLTLANGWVGFLQVVDLFGCSDLAAGSRWMRAQELLHELDTNVYRLLELGPQDLLPVAASVEELDLFVMTRRHARVPGRIIWLAQDVVDTFPSFDEYFLAMMDYNRREYATLLREHSTH